ncbi:MAG: N-acetyl-gamma-glutamyl-phosphate reductase, partial [Polyangiaceae bacterium]
LKVGIVGASGTSGAVAARLVAAHPALELAVATSDKLAGEGVAERLGLPGVPALRFTANAGALDAAVACDAVLLATAADVSMKLAPALHARGVRVVDLSGAFRLEAASYPRWYGFEHGAASLLPAAHYGLPELLGPPAPGALVANPGCYPTAALLAIGPLVRAGLVDPATLVVDGKSGVTGAGRQTGDAYSFLEIDGDVRAYRVLGHQHAPEMARHLGRLLGAPPGPAAAVKLTFTAHLLPVARGLLATCYARPRPGATAERVAECLRDAYAGKAFVRAVAPGEARLARVVGTNLALVGASADDDMVVAVGAIDNLLKGATGTALQNLNALAGWDEALGLEALQRFAA